MKIRTCQSFSILVLIPQGSTCPRLVLEVSNEGEGEKEGVTIGADDICDELHSANKQWRQVANLHNCVLHKVYS